MLRLPEEENLEIAYLSHLFDNMSESYKIFWFQAIVNGVVRGQAVFTYEELLDEMVADAWYMVSEYRLNLGPSDNLEALVHYVRKISGIKSSEKKEEILDYLRQSEDKELKKKKRTLSPTTRNANSKKSNHLPVWDVYFPRLCELEYLSYQARWKFGRVQEEFERCRKEHVNSDEVWAKLYREGLTREVFCQNLEEILLPVYQSAHNMGFGEWKYQE